MRLRLWCTRTMLLAVLPLTVSGCGLGGGGGAPATTSAPQVNEALIPKVKRQHNKPHKHHSRPLPPPSKTAAQVVAAAAALSQAQPGVKVIASTTTRVPGDASAARIQGTGVDAIGQGAVLAHLSVPVRAGGRVHTYPMIVVVRGGTMYLLAPKALASRVPGGKRWWAISLADLPKLAADPKLGPVLTPASALNSPGSYLAYVKNFATGMAELGQATVDGIHTTHYKALVPVSQAATVLPPELESTLGPPLQAAATADPKAIMAIDVWVDASHLVRRLHLSMTARTKTGQPIELSLQHDYVSYLGVPTPSVPHVSNTAHPASTS